MKLNPVYATYKEIFSQMSALEMARYVMQFDLSDNTVFYLREFLDSKGTDRVAKSCLRFSLRDVDKWNGPEFRAFNYCFRKSV